jgi:hypothetical protein
MVKDPRMIQMANVLLDSIRDGKESETLLELITHHLEVALKGYDISKYPIIPCPFCGLKGKPIYIRRVGFPDAITVCCLRSTCPGGVYYEIPKEEIKRAVIEWSIRVGLTKKGRTKVRCDQQDCKYNEKEVCTTTEITIDTSTGDPLCWTKLLPK